MTAINIQADARALPLPDNSVDLVVTSPPYYILRDYQDDGASLAGQIGNEKTPQQWLHNMWDCTREWIRVVKPTGNIFVNLGDKYSTGNSGDSGLEALGKRWAGGGHSDKRAKTRSRPIPGMQPKSLLGLPWLYALGCTGALAAIGGPDPIGGDARLILRSEIIWSKPNGL